jgi:hypothetical protein
MESRVTSKPEDEKIPPDLSVAFRISDWVDSLPEFWQPVANGALFIFILIGLRALWLVPIAVALALYNHSTFHVGDLSALALLPLAIVAGGLSGLSYSIGRRIVGGKRIGAYAAGFIAGVPYTVFLLLASRWLEREPILARFDGFDWVMVFAGCVICAIVVEGPSMTEISGEREVRRVGILIAAGIVLFFVVWAMTYPPLCWRGGKYCR